MSDRDLEKRRFDTDISLTPTFPWAGRVGVDDAGLEVVDPAKVPAIEGVKVRPLDPAKRARELKEALPSAPDRPENLYFER